jgi:hypothetical protein
LKHYILVGSSWNEIADDSRRQVLLLLKDSEKTPTEMAKSFEFTLPVDALEGPAGRCRRKSSLIGLLFPKPTSPSIHYF